MQKAKYMKDDNKKPLVVLEMANNHMGSTDHGLVTIDQFPITLTKSSEVGTTMRMGKVTHKMIRPIRVSLARKLLQQTYPVHNVVRGILYP